MLQLQSTEAYTKGADKVRIVLHLVKNNETYIHKIVKHDFYSFYIHKTTISYS